MTRKEYMDGLTGKSDRERAAAHRAYYAQFVTPGLRNAVEATFGLERLKASTDPHLNDIPLGAWDQLANRWQNTIKAKLEAAGDFWSLGGGVCTVKEAARQLIEKEA